MYAKAKAVSKPTHYTFYEVRFKLNGMMPRYAPKSKTVSMDLKD